MKLYKIVFAVLLSVLLVGCGNKDFTGKALNSYLGGPVNDSQCQANKAISISAETPTLFEVKGKVLISENNYKESSQLASKASDITISQGKELVVVVNEKCVKSERENASNVGLSSALEISDRAPASDKSFLITLSDDILLSELEYLAESDACVKGVGENVMHKVLAAPNDPLYSQQEHFTNIRAIQGWDVFYSETSGIQQDVIVAVIDSGVDQDHPDLMNNRWINTNEIAGNGQDDDGNGYIDDIYGYNFASNRADPNPQAWPAPDAGDETHGTHVAGLAAAHSNNSIGVAGVNGIKSKIMSLNIFGARVRTSTEHIDNAIRYAADNGAHVINLSVGGEGATPTTDAAIKYAISKGTVVIMAAGNSNADTAGFTPARYGQSNAGAMTVGASDSVSNIKCGFSNYSTTYVEIAAPGCKAGTAGVLATLNGGGYGRIQGTSMASPITAGAASLAYGLIWARTNSKPIPAIVEEVMKAGARVESGLIGSFRDGKVVDLAALSTEVNRRFPAGVSLPNTDPGCP